MKFYSFLIWCLGITLFLSGCGNKSSEQQVSEQAAAGTKTEEATTGEDHEAIAELRLDNGSKWIANTETTQGIINMKKLVEDLPAQPAQQDYKILQESLVSELNLIFQKCTMTGEAHEQLHHYLLPLKDLFEQLGKSSGEQSGEIVDQILIKLREYDQYFQ